MRLPRVMTRLLPWTICAMAALLVVKSVTLVRAAVPAGVPAAAAATAEAPSPHGPAPGGSAPVGSANGASVPGASVPGVPAANAPPTRADSGDAPAQPREDRLADNGRPPPQGKVEVLSPATAKPSNDALVSDSERALLLDLRQRRGELDAREAALAGREALLSAAEKRLGVRVDELTTLQHRLEALETSRKERDEANWRGLVKLYETMKPRDSAVIFNDLDLPVLLQVVDRMKEAKSAPVLAAMLPDRARLLTAELAQMRARANSLSTPPADAPAAPSPASPSPASPSSASPASPAPSAASPASTSPASGSAVPVSPSRASASPAVTPAAAVVPAAPTTAAPTTPANSAAASTTQPAGAPPTHQDTTPAAGSGAAPANGRPATATNGKGKT